MQPTGCLPVDCRGLISRAAPCQSRCVSRAVSIAPCRPQHEQQVAQLRQQLQETEGLLEEERLRVATLQADQALKAYWATSGSVAALKARVEELEHQNAALLDCSARCVSPVLCVCLPRGLPGKFPTPSPETFLTGRFPPLICIPND